VRAVAAKWRRLMERSSAADKVSGRATRQNTEDSHRCQTPPPRPPPPPPCGKISPALKAYRRGRASWLQRVKLP